MSQPNGNNQTTPQQDGSHHVAPGQYGSAQLNSHQYDRPRMAPQYHGNFQMMPQQHGQFQVMPQMTPQQYEHLQMMQMMQITPQIMPQQYGFTHTTPMSPQQYHHFQMMQMMPQMMPQLYGNFQNMPQQNNQPQMMSRQNSSFSTGNNTFSTRPPQRNNFQTTSRRFGRTQRFPRSNQGRSEVHRNAFQEAIEASMTYAPPTINHFQNQVVADTTRNPIDVGAFMAQVEDQITDRRLQATIRATTNLESNRNLQNPFHFLRLPLEIRQEIYDQLFNGARMTYAAAGLGLDPWGITQRGPLKFQRENMPKSILVVCKDIRTEASRILFANLVVDGNAMTRNFDPILSLATKNQAQVIWNVQPHSAFNLFPNMRLWVLSESCIINARFWTEFTTLNSKEMFADAVGQIDGGKMPGKDFLELVRVAPRPRHVTFFGKVRLLCCYNVGHREDVLFRVVPERPVCFDEHESIGQVYLDFFKEEAIFDRADAMGHDACIMALRRM